MKKIILSLLVVAASMNVFAAIDYTAKAKIKVTSSTEVFDQVTVASSEAFSTTANKYCAVKQMENLEVAIYAVLNNTKYGTLALKDLEGAALALKTDEGTNYTINFSGVIGTLYLIDAVANKNILITEGGSYAFTAEANQTIADRFSIAKSLPATFINNKLVIADAAAGAEVNVTPFSFVEGRRVDGQKVTYTAPVNQALNGNYFEVEYTNKNGVARKFIVNANPVLD